MEPTATPPTPALPIDPEIKGYLEKIGAGFAALQRKHDDVEKRLAKHGLTLGDDGEAKHNLTTMAATLIDLEAKLAQARRSRYGASGQEPFEAITVREKGERGVYHATPEDAARAAIMDSPEYRRALNSALRKSGNANANMPPDAEAVLRFDRIPESVAGRVEAILGRQVKADGRLEVKAGTTDTGLSTDFFQGAGVFAPPTMEREVDRMVLESSPLLADARTVNVGGPAYIGVIRNLNRDTVSASGERSTPTPATQVARYTDRRIEIYDFRVSPGITRTTLEDSQIDLVGELQSDCAEDYEVLFGQQSINGSGVNELEGLMVSSEVGTFNSGVADSFTMDSIRELTQQIKVRYKLGGKYYLSRGALTTIMLMRDETGGPKTGQYLWQPSNTEGNPSRLVGYPWAEMVDMDAPGANTFPVLFGNMYRGYRVARRRGLTILRDELTAEPYVLFKMSQRLGGRVWLGEALCKLKCAV